MGQKTTGIYFMNAGPHGELGINTNLWILYGKFSLKNHLYWKCIGNLKYWNIFCGFIWGNWFVASFEFLIFTHVFEIFKNSCEFQETNLPCYLFINEVYQIILKLHCWWTEKYVCCCFLWERNKCYICILTSYQRWCNISLHIFLIYQS